MLAKSTVSRRYKNEFGFTLSSRDILVDDVRVRGVGVSQLPADVAPPSGNDVEPTPEKVSDCVQFFILFFLFLIISPHLGKAKGLAHTAMFTVIFFLEFSLKCGCYTF
jgi:hypothetical protein